MHDDRALGRRSEPPGTSGRRSHRRRGARGARGSNPRAFAPRLGNPGRGSGADRAHGR